MTRSAAYSRWSVSLLLASGALSLLATGPALHGASKLGRPRATKFRVTDYLVADDCAMFGLFGQVARTANVGLGFENLPGCGFGKRTNVPAEFGRVLDASTPREAFDEIASLNQIGRAHV